MIDYDNRMIKGVKETEMPRKARERSEQQIYHVILRGINRQQIFYDEEDYRYFEGVLNRYKKDCGFQLLAYCLMGNHVHLLIMEQEEPIGNIFRHIGSAFVYWYNNKYDRVGHLFQDRYKSEPIDTEQYLLTVFRYILNNPVKAQICRKAEEYLYSSAREYLLGVTGITDLDMIRNFLDDYNMREFICAENDDECLEIEENPKRRCSDETAKQIIMSELGTFTPVIDKNSRDKLNGSICQMIRKGISIRQLSRLTGISKKIIENALK